MTEDEERVALNIRFPRTTHEKLRKRAFLEKRSITSLVIEAVEQFLERNDPNQKNQVQI